MLVFALILLQSNPNTEKGILLHITSKVNKKVTKINRIALSEMNQSDFNFLFETSGSILPYCYSHTSSFVCV